MAEQIKSFFKKKIADKKFKHAGKGYKLNESTPSTSTSASPSSSVIPPRQEPTEDAKVAGQVTLARIEGMKKNYSKFNTSFGSIQAQVRRELQQEKLLLQKQSQEKQFANEIRNSEQVETVSHFPAVSGIYYRCPIISEEVLDRETWYEKIQEFFSTQLLDNEVGLSASLVIHSCNSEKEKIQHCVETLCKYLDNIINNPSEEKYWKIRMSNKVFVEKVKPFRGSMELLKGAGFVQQKLVHQEDKEEDFLIWSPERSTIDNLKTLIDALHSTEPVQLVLDRNITVLLPTQAAERTELPPEFYIFSKEDLKHELAERSANAEIEQMLLTRKMREKLTAKPMKKFRFTLIRIKFPDNIILQGTFEVIEKFQEVINFIKQCLANKEIPFNIITDTRQIVEEKDYEFTLEALNLVPAVVLTFNCSSEFKTASNYLNEETLSLLSSM